MLDLWNESLRHHSNAWGQFRQRDRDLSHLQGRPGYNTGVDFRAHFERNFGPPRRNTMREAGPPA